MRFMDALEIVSTLEMMSDRKDIHTCTCILLLLCRIRLNEFMKIATQK